MTRLRQTIAKRLKQTQENAALLTTFNEVDDKYNRDEEKTKKISETMWNKIRLYVFFC